MVKKKTLKSDSKPKTAPQNSGKKDFLVVGLGASAGGIKALQNFFSTMPPNCGMAFVVIQHLSPDYESNLPEIIKAQTGMSVIQVNEEHLVEPNNIYVIPPNRQLEIVDGSIRCAEFQNERGERVAIDIFFRTLASQYKANAVCVVLSGTGTDGTLGLKAVKEANGFTIVQDPEDAEYDSMPRSAIATQLADWVLPVRQMPEKLIQFRDSSERLHLTNNDGDDWGVAKEIQADESLRKILTVLRVRTGHDFSNYKTPTLIRRIARHLQIHELEDIPAYLEFLREKPDEIQSLLKNLLINVTNFFRDSGAWKILGHEIVPRLFAGKKSGDTVRVWSCGCASGEEAYSLAIILSEFAESLPDPPKIQVFATDVDEDAVNEAREHRYPQTIEADVSPERLKNFFVKEGKYYRIKKELREMVLFAPHNVLRDPPFSKLNLITCRNLLIYLNRETQDRVMEIFHFALLPQSYLFLGSSETAEAMPQLFSPVDKKMRIYSRRPVSISQQPAPKLPVVGQWEIKIPQISAVKKDAQPFSLGEVHYKLLESFAPPSVLVNQDFDIQYVSETATRFLTFRGGEPSNNLLKLVHHDLLPDLRAALFAAQREQKTAEFPNVHAAIAGREIIVKIIVRPVEIDNETSYYLFVLFDDESIIVFPPEKTDRKNSPRRSEKDEAMEAFVMRLEEDLKRTKETLRATIEQHEISTEELKASNEELQAINEELRSTTEELETSKEELQSVNEELTTVNQELKEKIDETSRTNSDLNNLMASTNIATIFLDRQFRIKRYTPPVERIFNITPLDVGRPLEHFTHKLDYQNLVNDAVEVLRNLRMIEGEVRDSKGFSYLTRFVPYRTVDDRIEGVVLNFIDITERKRFEEALRTSEQCLKRIVNIPRVGVLTFNYAGTLLHANDAFIEMIGFTREEFEPQTFTWSDFTPPEYVKISQQIIEQLRATGRGGHYEKEYFRKDGTRIWLMLVAADLGDGTIVEYAFDITERKRTEEELRRSQMQFELMMELVADYAIIFTDLNGRVMTWNKGAEKIFGWTADEITGNSADLIFLSEDRRRGLPEKERQTALETGRAEDERWHYRKNGEKIYVSGVTTPLQNGIAEGFVKICRDLTGKIEAEKVTLEKEMLRRLVSAQEDERRRIARDIHDHFGQQITALRLKLDALKNAADQAELLSLLNDAEKTAAEMDANVDFIAWELRPASLDDLGLLVALANFVSEWSNHTGIEAEFHSTGLTRTRLDFEIESNLYRIAQEALNNILKHAGAGRVSVLLEKTRNQISLIIEDDGIGFITQDKTHRAKGLGLIGMTERAKICGGTFEIESAKGKGTTVFVRIPLPKKQQG